MANKLTQDDFTPVYMNVSKNPETGEIDYPKLVLWAADAPFNYDSMQVSATILQRQMTRNSDWEFIATVKPNDPTLTTTAGSEFSIDRFAESEGAITLPVEWDFDDAIDAIYQEVDRLVSQYV